MKVQIRRQAGEIFDSEIESLIPLVDELKLSTAQKVSFDLLEGRLALYADGTYQIFGGLTSYPPYGSAEQTNV